MRYSSLDRDYALCFFARHGGQLPVEATDQPCTHCGTKKDVTLESSRTAYYWDGKGKDPNAPIPLCPPCAVEHHQHWDDMWDQVNG